MISHKTPFISDFYFVGISKMWTNVRTETLSINLLAMPEYLSNGPSRFGLSTFSSVCQQVSFLFILEWIQIIQGVLFKILDSCMPMQVKK